MFIMKSSEDERIVNLSNIYVWQNCTELLALYKITTHICGYPGIQYHQNKHINNSFIYNLQHNSMHYQIKIGFPFNLYLYILCFFCVLFTLFSHHLVINAIFIFIVFDMHVILINYSRTSIVLWLLILLNCCLNKLTIYFTSADAYIAWLILVIIGTSGTINT